MHLHSYRLKNYRRLSDVRIELAPDISIFVGANNSGKTSATQALHMFLSGSKDRFSLFDFSSHVWKALNALGAADPLGDAAAIIPSITLDLWFEVSESDLYLVMPILPSSDWEGTHVGMRVEFAARSVPELLARYRSKHQEAAARAAALPGGAGNYVPWPKSLADYLERELQHEFEFQYYVLDRGRFDLDFVQAADYLPVPVAGELGGAAILKSLVKVDFLDAQRHLADSASGFGGARAESLSRRLSHFYQRNLEQRGEDDSALKALFDSELGLNEHLKQVFEPTLKRLETLGYRGLSNPRLEIISGLNPTTVLSLDARVHYIVGDGDDAVRLPDSYNGLGFKNLIYMVVEILDYHERWKAEEEKRAPLHLIFVEEPEAHLHAQLQQVFIRNVLTLLETAADGEGAFSSQIVVTTHSPHILYEGGFAPIRYFRRHTVAGAQTTQVLNLSSFQVGDPMQRIYPTGIGKIDLEDGWLLISKPENFRCPSNVLAVANAIRRNGDDLVQIGGRMETAEGVVRHAVGSARIFVLPADDHRDERLSAVKDWVAARNNDPAWQSNAGGDVKVLVIVHRMAAKRLGFGELYAALNDRAPEAFKNGFLDASAWPLRPLVSFALPMSAALGAGREFEAMTLLRSNSPLLIKDGLKEKNVAQILGQLRRASLRLVELMNREGHASVREVLLHLRDTQLIALDPRLLAYLIEQPVHRGEPSEDDGEEIGREIAAMDAFLACPAGQLWGYGQYVSDQSPFSTQQGVKGAEFPRVLVVVDDDEGTHVQFSYEKYFGIKPLSDRDRANIREGKETAVERTRRLFYVCCTRALNDLVVVFFSADANLAVQQVRASGLFPEDAIHTTEDLNQ
jgi:hypothetical protein